MSQFTPEEIDILREFVTDPEGNFFVVTGPTGMVGAIYARYSRAKTGFRETLLREFLNEGVTDPRKANELIERVLIAFGDDSVGELEGTHLSIEQVSNLATKVIEDRRIGGSPIEQSTRYVFYDQKDANGNFKYLREPKIMKSRFAKEYISTMDLAFRTYSDLVNPMQEFLKKLKPIENAEYLIGPNKEGMKLEDLTNDNDIRDFKTTYNIDLRTKACDTIRVLLPAATLTNVGIFGNGRFFQNLLTHLHSSDLDEMLLIGESAHRELNKVIPKYVQRAKRDDYLVNVRLSMQHLADKLLFDIKPDKANSVTLLENNPNKFLDYIIANMLFEYAQHPSNQLRMLVNNLPEEKKLEIIEAYHGNRTSRRNRPGRALEFGYPFTFNLVGDFGIYRDLHRHRMLTQMRQRLSTRNGFYMPELLVEAGFKDKVESVRDKVADLYERMVVEYPEESQYPVLFGFNIRWIVGFNFREAMHMWELRTIKQGHPTYRKICQQMYNLANENPQYKPLLKEMKFVDFNEYFWSRAESEALQRIKERKLNER